MECETVKIMPSSEEQGEFVVINKSDYDEKLHKLFDDETVDSPVDAPKKRGRSAKE